MKILKYKKKKNGQYELQLESGEVFVLYEEVILKFELLLKKIFLLMKKNLFYCVIKSMMFIMLR